MPSLQTSFPRGGKKRKLDEPAEGSSTSTTSADSSIPTPTPSNNDHLFTPHTEPTDTSSSTSTSTKKKRSKSSSSTSATPTPPTPIPSHLGGGHLLPSLGPTRPPIITQIGPSQLAKNFKLLAIVKSVTPSIAIFSLPNMLSGYVRREESCPPLDSYLTPNQRLSTKVIHFAKDTTGTRIELSLRPSQINKLQAGQITPGLLLRGTIASLEDFGCFVNVSIAGIDKCFCAYKDMSLNGVESSGSEDAFEVGMMMDFKVVNFDTSSKTKVVKLCLPNFVVPGSGSGSGSENGSKKNKSKTKPKPTITTTNPANPHDINSIQTNMLVNVSVEGFAQNGLLVSFLTHFHGAIDHNHVHIGEPAADDEVGEPEQAESESASASWKPFFKDASNTKNLLARIVTIDTASRTIRLSMLPHLVEEGVEGDQVKIGTVLGGGETKVVRVDTGVGALLRKKKQNFYVHISKIADESPKSKSKSKSSSTTNKTSIAALSKLFKPNTQNDDIPLRVISNHLVDNLNSCSAAPSVVEVSGAEQSEAS